MFTNLLSNVCKRLVNTKLIKHFLKQFLKFRTLHDLDFLKFVVIFIYLQYKGKITLKKSIEFAE